MFNKIKMYKKLYLGNFVKTKLLKGIEKLYNCVKITLGPKGSNVILEQNFGKPVITKDGVTVAKEINLKDKLENIGAQIVKEVAHKTNDDAGDGTTTATVLVRNIIKESYKNILLGKNPTKIKNEIKILIKIIIKRISKISKKIKKDFEIFQVASVSANNDKKIGGLIAKAISKIGKNGNISLENGKFNKNELEIVKGYCFDNGYISHYFLKDNEKHIVFEKPYILIHYKKILNFNKLIPILEKIQKKSKPLLIIADDIENEILTTLILNNARGIIKVSVVKTPGFGNNKRLYLEDISIFTGGKIIKEYNKKIRIKDLGKSKKVEISKNLTKIIKGKGKKKNIKNRIKELKKELNSSDSKYDSDNIKDRISKLSGGVAIIKVGGSTSSEVKEKKFRIEDALNATKAAIDQGIVPGGGIALIQVSEWLKKKIKNKKKNTGYNILIKSMYSPFKQIIKNSGKEPKIILKKILLKNKRNFGYNIVKSKYCNLIKAGIIDPAKVLKSALINAVSISLLILNTNCSIVFRNNKKNDIN